MLIYTAITLPALLENCTELIPSTSNPRIYPHSNNITMLTKRTLNSKITMLVV